MSDKIKSVPSVSVNYARNGASTKANALGMRPMQERAYERRGEQYLLIKSPPASGKSRALMFVALHKLRHDGCKQAIITVPEKSIGASFHDEPLSQFGFEADWKVEPKWNLCNAPGDDEVRVDIGKVRAVGRFVPFKGVALGDVLEVVLGEIVGRLALLAGRDGSGEVRPLLDRDHPVLPRSEQVERGLQHGIELGLGRRRPRGLHLDRGAEDHPQGGVAGLDSPAGNDRTPALSSALYGGRPGTLGFFRIARNVLAHLAVTGSIAAGDSFVQQIVGHLPDAQVPDDGRRPRNGAMRPYARAAGHGRTGHAGGAGGD